MRESPREYSGFQVTGIIEWGQKFTPKNSPYQKLTPKKSHAEFLGLKNFQKALNDTTRKIKFLKPSLVVLYLQNYAARWGYTGTTTNLQIPYLNYTSKNLLVKISTPQNCEIHIKNFNPLPPKNHLVISITWNPEYPPGGRVGRKFE